VLGLLPAGMQQVSGTIMFDGRPIDSQASDSFRRKKISAIFQDHTASLDPLMYVGDQVRETILAHDC
jgi:peptide/nickel transport system ATP-binding protein